MGATALVPREGEIDPPARPTVEFKFWRWLPRWHRHYGCPDCRATFALRGGLARHLRLEHPRWRQFLEGLESIVHPAPVPLSERWKDPAFRAKNAAGVRAELARRWKDPAFRANHAAGVLNANLDRRQRTARAIVEALDRLTGRKGAQ
jgi:hypothetical protein